MAGFIIPAWGREQIKSIEPFERLRLLAGRTAIQGLPLNDPASYLELSLLPMFAWSRPKSWRDAAKAFSHLLARL